MAQFGQDPRASGHEWLSKGWRNVRAASPRQLAGTALLLGLALLLARLSWQLPVLGEAERSLYDLRAYIGAPEVAQDGRIQIVAYTDQTLIAARKRSPLDRGLLSRALKRLDGMGAKAIGIDILFDQPQGEDDELVETLRSMKTPVFVAYAHIAGGANDIVYEQQQFLDRFVERLKGSKARPASVPLDYSDGVTRSWPRSNADDPPLLAMAMVAASGNTSAEQFAGYKGAIRFRRPALRDTPVFFTLPIDLFADPALTAGPELANTLSGQIAGRYVLIGGDIVDFDRFETPITATTDQVEPGLLIHAAMIAQMLDRARMPAIAGWQLWLVAGLVVCMGMLTSLLEARVWKILPFLVAQLLLIGGLPFYLQIRGYDTLSTPAAGWVLGWILAFIAVTSAVRASGAVERQFAQSALGKFLPSDIAREIIDHPEQLTLSGSKRELFILFSDLEGFTKMSHALEPEMVARLLNEYLDRLSDVVLEHGGIIDKYVGDAVVAFWGAPIARADDGRSAAQAGYALWQAGERFRNSADPALPPIGKTRVGMHFGEAVVGNFGGERRIQYTALGDAMNTAARLESANKSLDSAMMASREFAEASGLDWWRPMGRVVLRGRASPVDLFEPAPGFPEADRALLTEAVALTGVDTPRAVRMVETIAARHPADLALRNLLGRMRNLGEDDAYVLG